MKTYKLGDAVLITIAGQIEGIATTVQTTAYVRSMALEPTDNDVYVMYGLTRELPRPYHYGKSVSWWRKAEEIDGIAPTP